MPANRCLGRGGQRNPCGPRLPVVRPGPRHGLLTRRQDGYWQAVFSDASTEAFFPVLLGAPLRTNTVACVMFFPRVEEQAFINTYCSTQ